MKNGKIEVEFVTHCLSSGNRDAVSDRFVKDSNQAIIWNQSWWYSALTSAIPGSAVREIKPGHFNFNPIVKAATQSYRRKYSRDKYRTHESIFPGTRVTFEFVVPDHVTESMVSKVMDYLGKFVGLSPYGFNLGYGKFELKKTEIAPSVNAEEVKV